MRVVHASDNAAVKAARKLSRARTRAQTGRLLAEGPNVITEAVESLERLFVTDDAVSRNEALVACVEEHGVDVVMVDDALLASLAGTQAPQGMVGVARRPDCSIADALQGARFVVVLTAPSEPGNAGTVIRTAAAAGADAVVFSEPAVDPTNAKTVRASAGALFHVPVATAEWGIVEAELRSVGLRLIGADGAGSHAHWEADLTGGVALVFGNEAHGMPAQVAAGCDEIVSVPMAAGIESLNLAAAAAVCSFEAARQRAHAAHASERGVA